MPGALVLATSADGSATPTERMAIRADGTVQIPNRSAPTIVIDPTGFLTLDEISAPSAPSSNQLSLYAVDDGAGTTRLQVKDSAGRVTTLIPGELIAIIEDQKTQGTDAQDLSSGSDQTRELNTLAYNRNSLVSLSNNRFTAPAGTLEISWSAPVTTFIDGPRHQTLLYNVTDSTEVARGRSVQAAHGDSNHADDSTSEGSTVVTISEPKAFEIRHRVSDSVSGGQAANFGTEVYTRVVIRRA